MACPGSPLSLPVEIQDLSLTTPDFGRLRESVISFKETFNTRTFSPFHHLSPMRCSCTLALPTGRHSESRCDHPLFLCPSTESPGKTSRLVTLGSLPALPRVLNITEDKSQTKWALSPALKSHICPPVPAPSPYATEKQAFIPARKQNQPSYLHQTFQPSYVCTNPLCLSFSSN